MSSVRNDSKKAVSSKPEGQQQCCDLSLIITWMISFLIKSLQVCNQVQTSWSKLNGFKWGQGDTPECLKSDWLPVTTLRAMISRQNIASLKFVLSRVQMKNTGILSVSWPRFHPPPSTTLPCCGCLLTVGETISNSGSFHRPYKKIMNQLEFVQNFKQSYH